MCVFAGILGGPIAENGLAIARSEGRIWYLGHQTAVMTQEGRVVLEHTVRERATWELCRR
jgi:hypothetical protein